MPRTRSTPRSSSRCATGWKRRWCDESVPALGGLTPGRPPPTYMGGTSSASPTASKTVDPGLPDRVQGLALRQTVRQLSRRDVHAALASTSWSGCRDLSSGEVPQVDVWLRAWWPLMPSQFKATLSNVTGRGAGGGSGARRD